jgi:predicted nucleic acid-binding protein
MNDKAFVDTNVLVYAHDLDAGEKQPIAIEIISDLWESGNGVISTQVLQELYVTLTKKVPSPPNKSQVRRILNNYLAWELAVNNGETILQASEIEETYNISFWDAMVVSAAYSKNAAIILTEDLSAGLLIEGIRIVNPFRQPQNLRG